MLPTDVVKALAVLSGLLVYAMVSTLLAKRQAEAEKGVQARPKKAQ
jgi:hypothetical protein